MPSWNADQYLQFARERTRPARDLLARIEIDLPGRVIDLGCGPGNSTELLTERWPRSEICGLDSSSAMIDAAGRKHPEIRWALGDIADWAGATEGMFDVVFSNAALHWVPDHARLYSALLGRVAPGGALAVQVPANLDSPAQLAMRELAASADWQRVLPPEGVRQWYVHDVGFYYDCLAPAAQRVDLWTTEYIHILPSAAAVVEWYKGTGLRPFLDALPTDGHRDAFLAEYLALIARDYPLRQDGRVLFPFRRLFVIAYR
jgi:trans-aconitate 2-methyltransferase